MDEQVTRRNFLQKSVGIAGLIGGVSGSGCLGSASKDKDTEGPKFRVGSKPFTEQRILGYMAYEALSERTNLRTVDEISYGNSFKCWDGVVSGSIDMYWEYTGTQWNVLKPKREEKIIGSGELYQRVKRDAHKKGVEILNRAPFTNSYVLLTTPEWAEKTGVKSLSSLAEHVNAGNTEFSIALGYNFSRRSDGWPKLTEHYGFEENALEEWRGKQNKVEIVSVGLTYELIREGEIEVGMGYSTDAQLSAKPDEPNEFLVLEDDKHFFPPYNPAPAVNAKSIEKNPQVRDILNEIGPRIGGEEEMRRLNRRVVFEDKFPREVATNYLKKQGLI